MHIYLACARFVVVVVVVVCRRRLVGRMHLFSARQVCGCGLWRGRERHETCVLTCALNVRSFGLGTHKQQKCALLC